MKNILIAGENSYVGTSFEKWILNNLKAFKVNTVDMKNSSWIETDFSKYDTVFHVAAVVHQKEKLEMRDLYHKVNKELPISVATMAKKAGVKQFIFMSTMAVYGEDGGIQERIVIDEYSHLKPKTLYARSKVEAELEIMKLSDNLFNVVILRPPMVYGPNCPGNYAKLEKLAKKLPIFPNINNERSMIYIDNLSEFVYECIITNAEGIFFPQDNEYVNTSLMVQEIANQNNSSIYLSNLLGLIIKIFFKNFTIVKKVFGNLVYEKKEIRGN